MRRIALSLLVIALLGLPTQSSALTVVPVGSFDQPIFVTSHPANPDLLFVAERPGQIIVSGPGRREVFADLRPLVSCCEGERGVTSIALGAHFLASGRFYVAYTGEPAAGGAEGDFHVDAFYGTGGGLARERLLTIGHAEHETHYGGQLQFGPDGYLYVSTGDGGGVGDPFESGQDLESPLGKVLRIEPRPGEEPTYVSPAGNPFVGVAGLDEIWAYGLRNPWRFSFDRLSGDLVIADVGQDFWEEVDYEPSPAPGVVGGGGDNYGWNCREGPIAYIDAPASCGADGFTDPVFAYPHTDPGEGKAHGCAITGGYVVRDQGLGDLYGRYLYADFCAGELRSLQLPALAGGLASGDRSEGLSVAYPVSFGEDSCGRLYIASFSGGVYRINGDGPSACIVPAGPPAAPMQPADTHRRLLLHATRLGVESPGTFKLLARLQPCGGKAGRTILLRKGGHHFAAKALNRRCRARFRVQIERRATFRALLRGGPGAETLRSPRVVLSPAGPNHPAAAR